MGGERLLGAANGSWEGAKWELLLVRMGYKFATFGQGSAWIEKELCQLRRATHSSGTYDGGHEMGEVGSAFIELQPTDNAVIGEIFCYARFGDAKMLRELRLQGIRSTTAGAAAQ